ncbi:MAG: hypothetical protein Q9167_002739, partial [Letrouitia subvulpina]
DDAERRSFQYFRTRTSTQLCGYFVSDFWERLVPLAIHHEPAIKHAVVALASLHERYENFDESILRSNQDIIEGGYALQQYIKAIQEVAKPSGGIKSKNGTALTLRGHIASALSHVRSGVKILESVRNTDSLLSHNSTIDEDCCVPLDALHLIIARLDTQVAQNPLNTFPDEATNIQREALRQNFAKCSSALQAFLERNAHTMDKRSLQGAMVLKISAQHARTYLSVPLYTVLHDQMCWDQLYPEWEEQVSLCTAVIEAETVHVMEPRHLQNTRPTFCLDMSIIGPLFTVAHKCRDPILRRKAVKLLYSAPRQEGIWDGMITARVAERIVAIEEAGLGEVKCAADVPGWARINHLEVKVDKKRKNGTVELRREGSQREETQEGEQHVIEW